MGLRGMSTPPLVAKPLSHCGVTSAPLWGSDFATPWPLRNGLRKIFFGHPHLFIGVIFFLYHIATASSILTNISFETMGRVTKRIASIRNMIVKREKSRQESQPSSAAGSLLSDKNESATGMGVEDTDDDGNETDEEVEVTDDDGEEEFDGDAFSVLLAAGKADYLGKGTAFFIEMYWGNAKKHARDNCDYSFPGLRKTVPEALESVPNSSINRYFNLSLRIMEAYRDGVTYGTEEFTKRVYKSHRRIPDKTKW
jgi:hypothetical protein